VDKDLSLQVGNAFDVFGSWKQTEFVVETNRKWMKESFEITLHNSKKENVVVRVKQVLHRGNTGKITESSHEYKKLDAFNAAWDLPVEAGKDTKMTYTVEYTW
jgi:hypothetical protein